VGNAFLPTQNKSVMQMVGKKPVHPTKTIKRMNAERGGVIVAEQKRWGQVFQYHIVRKPSRVRIAYHFKSVQTTSSTKKVRDAYLGSTGADSQ